MHKFVITGITVLLIALVACGQEAPSSTSQSTPTEAVAALATSVTSPTTAPSTDSPSVLPTTASAAPTTPSEPDGEIPNGVTAEGFYYLGSPDAPVTLIDYSDFL